MPKFIRKRRIFNFRLIRIDLPRVYIEEISAFLPQNKFYPDLEKREGDQPKIGASCPGKNAVTQFHVTNWKFVKGSGFWVSDFAAVKCTAPVRGSG
jgi:hypothetical protein